MSAFRRCFPGNGNIWLKDRLTSLMTSSPTVQCVLIFLSPNPMTGSGRAPAGAMLNLDALADVSRAP